jgi:hypothetical protein
MSLNFFVFFEDLHCLLALLILLVLYDEVRLAEFQRIYLWWLYLKKGFIDAHLRLVFFDLVDDEIFYFGKLPIFGQFWNHIGKLHINLNLVGEAVNKGSVLWGKRAQLTLEVTC